MKKRLILTAALLSLFLFLTAGILYFFTEQTTPRDTTAEWLVALNEIEQLAKSGEPEQTVQKIGELQKEIRFQPTAAMGDSFRFLFLCGVCILCFAVLLSYVYFWILRPFKKLERFAREISVGNFDLPLDYERSNYFGAFTWAFDSMRREISRARACEREAIKNNKTVIATLSHDIKTPVSSIRAYAEGLEANMDTSPEKRAKYLGIIMKKCDEVSRLTNDLFLHSLTDIDKLKLSPEKIDLCAFIEAVTEELLAEQNDIRFTKPDFTAFVLADKNRLTQVVENLINNARKYAKTEIDIFLSRTQENVNLHFRDYGKGIPDEDLPFIFGKFYRGKNSSGEPGSGLGLYIAKYIAGQLDGDVLLYNRQSGLEVVVQLPVVS